MCFLFDQDTENAIANIDMLLRGDHFCILNISKLCHELNQTTNLTEIRVIMRNYCELFKSVYLHVRKDLHDCEK